jgi:fibronectin type 3 domain-containing protein
MTSSSYTTNYSDAGTHTVTVTVSDGTLTDSQVANITVINTTDVSPITVIWDANTDPELAGYKVYYGTSSGDYDTVVDVGTQTSFVLSNLISNETYYIAVTAYNTSNVESRYSNELIYIVPTG